MRLSLIINIIALFTLQISCDDAGFLGSSSKSSQDKFRNSGDSKNLPKDPNEPGNPDGLGSPNDTDTLNKDYDADSGKDLSIENGNKSDDLPIPGSIIDKSNELHQLTFDCKTSKDQLIYVGNNAPSSGINVDDDVRTVVVANGEFCPSDTLHLNLVFVVDHSGSMTKKSSKYIPEGGSDPTTAAGCGRYMAIKNVLAKLRKNKKTNEFINVAFVPFGTDLMDDKLIELTPMEIFIKNNLSPENMCSTNTTQLTNVSAGLKKAKKIVTGSDIKGKKVVFFITDGVPRDQFDNPDEVVNTGAKKAALTAAKSLAKVDNISLLSVFLGKSQLEGSGYPFLEELTNPGDRPKDRFKVKQAKNAEDLADTLNNFGDLLLDKDSGAASVLIEPYPEEDLGITNFDEAGKQANGKILYRIQTKPLVLLGLVNEWVDNVVTMTATRRDGKEVSSKVTFRYCRVGPCKGK